MLLAAAFLDCADIVRLAIENGADINQRRFIGSSTLYEAIEGISIENLESKVTIVELLVDYSMDINTTDNNSYTALY